MLTQKDIHLFLKNQGIRKSDTVLIHTSMRSLGEVEGGCDGVIDAFISYLSEGLFLVPTHTWANVDEKSPIFDAKSTRPCIGALPTVAAFRRDAHRSLHPTHSVAAFGARAEEFIRGEENAHSPASAGGVWQRLYDEGAKILLIGVLLNRNTYIHAIDEMLDLPNRLAEPIRLYSRDAQGVTHELLFQKHGENTGSEFFENYRAALEYHGALKNAPLGNATVGIFDTVLGTKVIKHLWSVADLDLCKKPMDIPKEYYLDLSFE